MKFRTLDAWRGVCALLVALFHLSANGHFYHFLPVRNGDYAVDFFFVLSGFVMEHAYGQKLPTPGGRLSFIIRRFGRLYPLHIFTLFIVFITEIAKLIILKNFDINSGEAPFTGTNSLWSLAGNIFLINGVGLFDHYSWNGPSWSISTEFFAYLMFLAFFLVRRCRTIMIIGLVMILGVAISLAEPHLATIRGMGLLSCFYGFAIGNLTYKVFTAMHLRGLAPQAWMQWLGLIIAALVFCGFVPFGKIIAPLLFSITVLLFAFEKGLLSTVMNSAVPQRLGMVSYSIYLVHFPLILVINGVLRAVQSVTGTRIYGVSVEGTQMIVYGGPWAGDALASVFIAILIVGSLLTYRWVEEPGRAYFNRLAMRFAPKPPTPAAGLNRPLD